MKYNNGIVFVPFVHKSSWNTAYNVSTIVKNKCCDIGFLFTLSSKTANSTRAKFVALGTASIKCPVPLKCEHQKQDGKLRRLILAK